MEQMTKDEAIAFAEREGWQPMSHKERADLQLRQDRLCMPFAVFHEAVEKALGRPVWTHEFGLNRDGLIAELEGKNAAPTMNEIVEMLPAEKTVVVLANALAQRAAKPSAGAPCWAKPHEQADVDPSTQGRGLQ